MPDALTAGAAANSVGFELAVMVNESACALSFSAPADSAVAQFREALGRFRIYALPFAQCGGEAIGITHDDCLTRWYAEVDDFSSLAELTQRADEHAEVRR